MRKSFLSALIGLAVTLIAQGGFATPEPGVVIDTVTNDPITGYLTVSGTEVAEKQITSMYINGYLSAPENFDGENFTIVLPAFESYQVNLYDSFSNYSTVTYVAPDTDLPGTTMLIISDDFLVEVGPALARLLADLDLNDVLNIDPNQCVIDTFWLIGCDFYLKELAINGTPDIQVFMTPTPNEGPGGSVEDLTINVALSIPESVIQTKIKKSY